MHLHRVTRDVYADRSGDSVCIPLRDVAGGVARGDEAIVVAAMAFVLAAAIARHVAEHLGMLGGEFVHRAHDLQGPRRRTRVERQRRQVLLRPRAERCGPRRIDNGLYLRGRGGLGARRRRRLARSRVSEDADNHRRGDGNREQRREGARRWRRGLRRRSGSRLRLG